MEEYVLLIEDEKHNNVFVKCKDLNEVEKKFYEFSNGVENFEIYKAINPNEIVEFAGILMKNILKF